MLGQRRTFPVSYPNIDFQKLTKHSILCLQQSTVTHEHNVMLFDYFSACPPPLAVFPYPVEHATEQVPLGW